MKIPLGPPTSATAFDAIPAELRAIPRWVCWRYQPHEGGRPAKVPKRATSRGNASSTDPTTWSTYQQAVAGILQFGHDGIGFVLSGDDDLVGIDLDDCRDPQTGALTQMAEALVERFPTYVEASVSGIGAHIVLRGQRPAGAGNKRTLTEVGVEIYYTGRFLVMTGNAIRREPVEDCQRQLEGLCRRLWPQPPSDPGTPARPASAVRLDDHKLIEKASAAANGSKFAALWTGDWSGYASQSEADLALVESLVWWSNCDRAQVARLWPRSGLQRAKMDREDYRERTIDSACEYVAARGGGYQGRAPDTETSTQERAAMKDHLAYFRLSPRIWDQPWSEPAKVLAIYILVNRHRITEGLYRLPKAYICQDLGWTLEQMTAPFAELLKAGFIKYDDKASVVLVAKGLSR